MAKKRYSKPSHGEKWMGGGGKNKRQRQRLNKWGGKKKIDPRYDKKKAEKKVGKRTSNKN